MRRLRQRFFNELPLDAVGELEDITDFWLLTQRDVMEESNKNMLNKTVHVPREATFHNKSTVEPSVQVQVSADRFSDSSSETSAYQEQATLEPVLHTVDTAKADSLNDIFDKAPIACPSSSHQIPSDTLPTGQVVPVEAHSTVIPPQTQSIPGLFVVSAFRHIYNSIHWCKFFFFFVWYCQ